MKKVQIYASVKAAENLMYSDYWWKVLTGFCNLYIDATQEDLNELECSGELDSNPFFQLMSSSDPAVASKEQIEEIKKDNSKVLEHPSALYFLDISTEDATKIENDYGVICKSDKAPIDENLLNSRREITCVKDELKHNWKEFLYKMKNEPTNAIVINDRYLFANDCLSEDPKKSKTPGIDAALELLDAIMPDTFSSKDSYHILIIYSEINNDVKCKIPFVSLLTKLNKAINKIRKYNVNFELWSIPQNSHNYERTHNRRVVTNYHLIRCEHSLAAFGNGKAKVSQVMNYDAFFSNGINGDSDAPYISIDLLLSDLSEINDYGMGHKETCMYKSGINGRTIKSQQDNKKIIFSNIENRLIKQYAK